MNDAVFLDYLGRQIKIGDVIISCHRGAKGGNSANLAIGVVTGFTESDILVTKFQRGCWSPSGIFWWGTDKGYGDDGNTWRTIAGRCAYGERCFITGMSEADLRQLAGISEGQGMQ
jgi:hypothetical protein